MEVADEILEVNGESLENSNHTDVIAHIHNVRTFHDLTALQKAQNRNLFQREALNPRICQHITDSTLQLAFKKHQKANVDQ